MLLLISFRQDEDPLDYDLDPDSESEGEDVKPSAGFPLKLDDTEHDDVKVEVDADEDFKDDVNSEKPANGDLAEHIAYHSCALCDFVTDSFMSLKEHTKEYHGALFICNICCFSATSEEDLEEHTKVKHFLESDNGKSFFCLLCDFASISGIYIFHLNHISVVGQLSNNLSK